jgi:hypothetical protein
MQVQDDQALNVKQAAFTIVVVASVVFLAYLLLMIVTGAMPMPTSIEGCPLSQNGTHINCIATESAFSSTP